MSATHLLLLLVNLVAHKHLVALLFGCGQRSGLLQSQTLLVLLVELLELTKLTHK